MEIKPIKIQGLDIPVAPSWLLEAPQAIPPTVPITQQVGIPIVNVPGCVEAHESNNKSKTVGGDDADRGLITYCDAGMPSFNPIDYNPENLQFTGPAKVPAYNAEQPETPVSPELPIPKTPPATAAIQCPTPGQNAKEPVGTYVEGFRKKVTEYKLIGNECVQITEAVPIPQQIVAGLPSGGQVMQVGGIAVIATTSALLAKPLADILLKVVKPTVKKVIKKIAAIRGKTVKIESVKDRRDQQRIRSHAIRKLKGKE